jgi:phosphomannomutase
MVIIDNQGNRLTPEKVSYFVLSELLKEQKGPVVANVECTKTVDVIAAKFNRPVKRVKVGHTFLMDGVEKNKACFGVEVAGHYVVPFIVPFDDSLTVSFYMACVLSGKGHSLNEETRNIPLFPFERVNFDCPDQKKFEVVEKLKKEIGNKYGKASFLDGIRIDREGGWALIRPSNTGPIIRLTVEGKTEKDKDEIKGIFSAILQEGIKKWCR